MSPRRPKLYLIDGANYLFRAYYAIRSLSNSAGLPTNALFGLTQMLLKLIKTEQPEYVAFCYDTEEATFRDELYEEYKANRSAPPDDLIPQFAYVKPLVQALGIPLLEKPGFEADDLIATLAMRYASEELDVVIVSADKDLMQLISDHITMLDEMRGKIFRQQEVREKFGVDPEQVIDVLALMGDKSDNVPGVPGIGPKTAAQLVQQFGNIDSLMKQIEEVKKTIATKILENRDKLELSRELVTLCKEVDIPVKLEDLKYQGWLTSNIQELFQELEFTKLMGELAPKRTISFEQYRLVTDRADLKAFVRRIKQSGVVSIDLETDSLDPMQAEIVGFALCSEVGSAAYIPVGHRLQGKETAPASGTQDLFAPDSWEGDGQLATALVLDELHDVLADPAILKVGQNLNYDFTILRRLGVEIRGEAFDTMLGSYLLEPSGNHGLDHLAAQHLAHTTIRYEDVVGKGVGKRSFREVELEVARDYACEDADVAFRLFQLFQERLKAEGLWELMSGMEMPLMWILINMQLAGIKIDREALGRLGELFSRELEQLAHEIYEVAGAPFTIGSPKQLGQILFEQLGLSGGKRTKTGYSTSQEVLEGLAEVHPLPRLVLRWRSLGKLKSTYIDALCECADPETDRVHTTFRQAATATGRLSSSDPNVQNIPIRTPEGRRIREAFIAEENFRLVSADYSQIELRILAHLSAEPALLEAFRRGEDVHTLTAAGIFECAPQSVTREQRAVGKTVNFATIYGQTAYGLSRQLGISVADAEAFIARYFQRYPGVERYREKVLEGVRQEGVVKTPFGRRRFFSDISSPNGQIRQMSERMAFNMMFQGTASDIMKRAMIAVDAGLTQISRGSRMLLQVHDELVLEVPEDEVEAVSRFLRECMEGAAELLVPLVVDVGVGKNWADAH